MSTHHQPTGVMIISILTSHGTLLIGASTGDGTHLGIGTAGMIRIGPGTGDGVLLGDHPGVGDIPVGDGALLGVRPGAGDITAGDQATRSIGQMYPDIVPAITARHMATTDRKSVV